MALVILAIAWAALGVAAGRDGFYGKKKTGNPAEPWVEVSRKPLVAAFGLGADVHKAQGAAFALLGQALYMRDLAPAQRAAAVIEHRKGFVLSRQSSSSACL